VTNSVKFTGSPPARVGHCDLGEVKAITLILRYHAGRLVIEVRDPNPSPPVLSEAGRDQRQLRARRPGRRAIVSEPGDRDAVRQYGARRSACLPAQHCNADARYPPILAHRRSLGQLHAERTEE
jgi:hypothetical protein